MEKGEWRYIKPNSLQGLFEKYAKDYINKQFAKKGIKRKAQYGVFTKVSKKYLNLLIDDVVGGKDVQTEAGSFLCRQVKEPFFRASPYARNFELDGGKKYNIFDLLNRDSKYPIFTFRNNGLVRFRNVMWRGYIRLRLKKRHKMYKDFYERKVEYKEMKYPKEGTKRKKRVIWRNNVKLKINAVR